MIFLGLSLGVCSLQRSSLVARLLKKYGVGGVCACVYARCGVYVIESNRHALYTRNGPVLKRVEHKPTVWNLMLLMLLQQYNSCWCFICPVCVLYTRIIAYTRYILFFSCVCFSPTACTINTYQVRYQLRPSPSPSLWS